MNEDERNIEQQEIVVDSLAKLMASVGIIRRCMTAVIASHPDPAQLRTEWETRRTGWVDEEMAKPFFGVQAYQEAYLSVLQGLSGEIDRAADAV